MQLRKDQQLFEEVLKGNRDSFRILFDRYYKSLCLYADTFLTQVDISEDVVQTVYINIWKNKDKLSHVRSVKSYLYQAVRNSCYNVLKHRNVEKNTLDALKMLDIEDESNEIQEKEEKFRKLHNAINELPSKTRQALKLSVFENLTYEEIGQKMNISMNTVKYHIKTAYQYLRKSKLILLYFVIIFDAFF